MNKETGGPAFPTYHGGGVQSQLDGMSLRDYFAAKAMQGMLASDNLKTVKLDAISSDCYRIADAMLKAREQ